MYECLRGCSCEGFNLLRISESGWAHEQQAAADNFMSHEEVCTVKRFMDVAGSINYSVLG